MSENYLGCNHDHVLEKMVKYDFGMGINNTINVLPMIHNLLYHPSHASYTTLGKYLHSQTQHIDKDINTYNTKNHIYFPKDVLRHFPTSKSYIMIRDRIGVARSGDTHVGLYRRKIIDNYFWEYIDNEDIASLEGFYDEFFNSIFRKSVETERSPRNKETISYTHFFLDTDYFLDEIMPILESCSADETRKRFHIIIRPSESKYRQK
ncbi:MAG: hypothetical protein ACLFSN_01080 [Candidatus Woesearchaeota archaeon]